MHKGIGIQILTIRYFIGFGFFGQLVASNVATAYPQRRSQDFWSGGQQKPRWGQVSLIFIE